MMIDFIINESGGVFVAHDSKTLDGYTHLDLDRQTGSAILKGPQGDFALDNLKTSVLELINEPLLQKFEKGEAGWLIRVKDHRLAKVSPLIVDVSN